jgi:hypothetical protein
MKNIQYCVVLIPFLISACAGKSPPMKDDYIRTVQKMNVGVVELTSNEFDSTIFYNCMKNYPASGISLDGQTRQNLESVGWQSGNMIASLQKQDFETYNNIKNYSLLLLLFRNKEQKNYIRSINFLSKQVVTLSLPSEQFSCENVLAAAKMIVIDSIPPYADVYINERKIGETPVWTSLDNGTYEVGCKLPNDIFPKQPLQVPGNVKFLCKRENQASQSSEYNNDENADFDEKSQSWFLYTIAGLFTLGSLVLPFLIF